MKVNEFYVTWSYPDSCCTTNCYVYGKDKELIAKASTKKAEKDCFARNVGRTLSLSRVLNKMYPGTERTNPGNRKQRLVFWEAYRKMTETPRWGLRSISKKDLGSLKHYLTTTGKKLKDLII